MALKEFQREGLRRDRNLSDLPSQKSALNNILATPKMLGTAESFTVEDLAPIKNIYITNITSSTFSTLNGITLEFSVIDYTQSPPAIDQSRNPLPFRPLVKIKNRLDTAYFSTGEPFFYGGDGPNASYYDSENIVRNPPTLQFDQTYGIDIEPAIQIIKSGNNLYRTSKGAKRTTANGNLTHLASGGDVDGFVWVAEYKEYEPYLFPALDELTLEDQTIRDNFWERGQFVYGNKVQAGFISLFGGVNWQGMFKPSTPGFARFYLRTTGSTVFKFQHPNYPSYSQFKYGKINVTTEISNGTFAAGGTYLTNLKRILEDGSRRWIKVICNDNVQLQTGDVIYLEIEEGPLVARQYEIYGLSERDPDAKPEDPNIVSGQTIFFVEATTDFNLNNVDYDAIPEVTDVSSATNAYNGIARYFPWERRPYKTYINSVKHKFTIPTSNFSVSGSRITFNDEQIYRSMMINDYIYDYRRRSTDVIDDPDPAAPAGSTIPVYSVRRYVITGCRDSDMSVEVEIDTNYNITPFANNDQYGYVDTLSGLLKFNASPVEATEQAERIKNEFYTGSISDTIDTATDGLFSDPLFPNTPTQELYYVARYGEAVVRIKYMTIDQFLERAVDYAIDWTYFTKDEDVPSGAGDKAWVLWYRTETSADYGPLNYKYLYAKDYEFYEIGDFKRFLDNSVLVYGTSRENGIDQRAFGKPKLINKGDQYNLLYSLLPVKSEYDPPVNFNEVVTLITGEISEGSRAITSISDMAALKEGNYIIPNTPDGWINGTNSFKYRARIIEKLFSTSIAITSELADVSSGTTNLYAVDHQGFITSLKITTSNAGGWNFEGDASEVKIGNVIVTPEDSGRSTYVRVINIEYDSVNQTGVITLDTALSLNGDKLVLVYHDRGVDIVKPLEAFCTDTGCGQHAYVGETTNTEFIAIRATNSTGANSTLNNYFSNNQSNVETINNGSAQIQWLLENNMGDVTQSNYTNGIFKNSVVTVKWDADLKAEGAADEKGLTSMNNNTYYPIGWIRGLVKISGKIWDGTLGSGEYEYYWIVRLGTNWQSNVDKFVVPESTPGAGDSNGLNRNRSFNPREIAGSLWNVKDYNVQVGSNNNGYLSQDGNISSSGDLDNAHAQANSGLGGWKTVGVDINLSATQQGYFENLDSIAPDAGSTTYVLKAGMYIRRMTSGGPFWIFKDFNDFQETHTVWGNNTNTSSPNGTTGTSGSGRSQQLIYLQEQQGPVNVTGNSLSDNLKYLHYRRKQYEVIPVNSSVDNATNGHLRLININANTSALVDNILQNDTNRLSVFTFANTTDNRELCCPPLDTSPPFDSSPIGLSTTSLEPDMSIGGLVNVRSINGNHPDDKIFPIPNNKDDGNPFDSSDIISAPVNKKFQVMFNGVKYDMLLSDTNPVVNPSP